MTGSAPGPAWIGIGAQRSGSTWLTDCLLEHPGVGLGASGIKELHLLYRGILDPTSNRTRPASHVIADRIRRVLRRQSAAHFDMRAYRTEFADTSLKRGEWTPAYLAAPWSASALREHVPAEAPVLVVLRDPVERFASSMRLEASRRTIRSNVLADRFLGTYAVWAGMYLEHLEAWANAIGRDRLVVGQYEVIRNNPQPWVDTVWSRMGLAPVELPATAVAAPSTTSRPSGWTWPEGLRDQLVSMYSGQRSGLEDRWGIDTSLWGS